MPIQSNITAADEWFSGTDKVVQFTITDFAGVAQNITGWALRFVLTRRGSLTALIEKTVGAGIAITNGAGGICQVSITDTDTNNLPTYGLDPAYEYELRRTDDGNEDVLAYGSVVLLQGKVTT